MLLRRFAPASVLVTEQGEILFTHGRTGAYLELAPGEPRNNLFDMTREGLQLELAAALRECARKGADVTRKNIPVKSNGDFVGVDLSVTKIKEPEPVRGLLLVTFRTVTDAKQLRKRLRAGSRAVGSPIRGGTGTKTTPKVSGQKPASV